MNDDFYVGYQDQPPPALKRFLRFVVVGSLLLAVIASLVIASGQRKLPKASFEFGTVRDFEGWLVADPYPTLLVERGPLHSRYLLVGPGKSGADELVQSALGQHARLKGTLIFREQQTMLEVVPGSVETDGEAAIQAGLDTPADGQWETVDLGETTLQGEIVGSKCYLGVMKPGSGVGHRACASLCIRGGVPPMLHVRYESGRSEGIVLVGARGEPLGIAQLRDLLAMPVAVTGRLIRRGDLHFLQAEPTQIRRLQ